VVRGSFDVVPYRALFECLHPPARSFLPGQLPDAIFFALPLGTGFTRIPNNSAELKEPTRLFNGHPPTEYGSLLVKDVGRAPCPGFKGKNAVFSVWETGFLGLQVPLHHRPGPHVFLPAEGNNLLAARYLMGPVPASLIQEIPRIAPSSAICPTRNRHWECECDGVKQRG